MSRAIDILRRGSYIEAITDNFRASVLRAVRAPA